MMSQSAILRRKKMLLQTMRRGALLTVKNNAFTFSGRAGAATGILRPRTRPCNQNSLNTTSALRALSACHWQRTRLPQVRVALSEVGRADPICPPLKKRTRRMANYRTKEAVNTAVESACDAAEAVLRGTITSAMFRAAIRTARNAACDGCIIRNVPVYRVVSDLLAAWEKCCTFERLSRRRCSGITEATVAAARAAVLQQVAIARETVVETTVSAVAQ
jgi:hypothetical protein